MRATFSRGLLLGALFTSFAFPGRGMAAPSGDPEVATSRTVEVKIAGPPADAEAVQGSLRELLQRLGLSMRATAVDRIEPEATRGPTSPDVVARALIDLRWPDSAIVMLSDGRTNRPPVPRLVERQGSRALLLEEVAHVVQAGTESLLAGLPAEGEQAAPAPPPSPPPDPEKTASRGRASSGEVDLATFATGQPFAKDSGVVFGGGVAGRLAINRDAWHPALWVLGAYHLPFGHVALPVELRANVWSMRALPTLQLVRTSRFLFEAGAGGGADIFVLAPGATLSIAQLDANRTDVSPVLSGILVAHLALGPTSNVFLAATIDWDLQPRRYVIVDRTRTALIETLSVRPAISLGFAVNLAGSGSAR